MSLPELVDAEVVEYRYAGPNFVIVRLSDGTECKITVNVTATRTKDQKNLDGTPIYNITPQLSYSWKLPPGRVVKVPKVQVPELNKPQDRRLTG